MAGDSQFTTVFQHIQERQDRRAHIGESGILQRRIGSVYFDTHTGLIEALIYFRRPPVPADKRLIGPHVHPTKRRPLTEDRADQPVTQAKMPVDNQPFVTVLLQRFFRCAPGDHLSHFRLSKQSQDGDMLASTP